MASLSGPATSEQMIQEELKQRDRMMTQSIQALAMDRLRSSVRSLSRETGFQSRPAIEPFAQAPLYIPNPEYMKWSNTLGKLVGTPMKQYSSLYEAARGGEFALRSTPRYSSQYTLSRNFRLTMNSTPPTAEERGTLSDIELRNWYQMPAGSGRRLNTILNSINQRLRSEWEEAQRMLPA